MLFSVEEKAVRSAGTGTRANKDPGINVDDSANNPPIEVMVGNEVEMEPLLVSREHASSVMHPHHHHRGGHQGEALAGIETLRRWGGSEERPHPSSRFWAVIGLGVSLMVVLLSSTVLVTHNNHQVKVRSAIDIDGLPALSPSYVVASVVSGSRGNETDVVTAGGLEENEEEDEDEEDEVAATVEDGSHSVTNALGKTPPRTGGGQQPQHEVQQQQEEKEVVVVTEKKDEEQQEQEGNKQNPLNIAKETPREQGKRAPLLEAEEQQQSEVKEEQEIGSPGAAFARLEAESLVLEMARQQQLEADMEVYDRLRTGNENCTRWLVYPIQHMAGLGSQLVHALLAIMVGWFESRALVLEPSFLTNYHCTSPPPPTTTATATQKAASNSSTTTTTTAAAISHHPASSSSSGFLSCFKDLYYGPPACRGSAGGYQEALTSRWSDWPFYWRQKPTTPKYRAESLENVRWVVDLADNRFQPMGPQGEHYSFWDMETLAAKRLWHLQDHVKDAVDRYKRSLPLHGNVCGFHIRRGDKVYGKKAEIKAVAAAEYVRQAVATGVSCDSCFLASDHLGEVLGKFTSAIANLMPSCRVVTMPRRNDEQDRVAGSMRGFNESLWLSGSSSQHESATMELLSEIEVLADAHIFVSSFGSNLARFLAVLRAARGKSRVTSLTVDFDWSPARRLEGRTE